MSAPSLDSVSSTNPMPPSYERTGPVARQASSSTAVCIIGDQSRLDELVVAGDAAAVVEDEDFEAGTSGGTAAGGQHLPAEGEDIAERA
jgi:hypothetical protein